MGNTHHSLKCPSQTQYETLEGSGAEAYLFDPHDPQTLPLSYTYCSTKGYHRTERKSFHFTELELG